LPEEAQKELKTKLSEKLFGQMHHADLGADDTTNEHFLEMLTKSITDIFKASRS
jgi:hypothetical protein